MPVWCDCQVIVSSSFLCPLLSLLPFLHHPSTPVLRSDAEDPAWLNEVRISWGDKEWGKGYWNGTCVIGTFACVVSQCIIMHRSGGDWHSHLLRAQLCKPQWAVLFVLMSPADLMLVSSFPFPSLLIRLPFLPAPPRKTHLSQ